MRKKLYILLTTLLLAVVPAGGAEGECSAFIEDQITEMSAWVQEAIEARGAEDWEQEAFLLERITLYSTELFPDEVTWAWDTLGDLYAEGLYCCDDEEDEDFEKSNQELALSCYQQAWEIYNREDALRRRREDDSYIAFRTELALKLGKIYVSPEWGLMDYGKAVECLNFAVSFSVSELGAEANCLLGLIYADEASGMAELQKAESFLQAAARAGNAEALAKLEELYCGDAYEWARYYASNEEFERAIQLLTSADDDVRCMEYLGYLYNAGLTGREALSGDRDKYRDPENAYYWYAKAAEAGSYKAMEWLIAHYVYDLTNAKPLLIDEQTAVAWGMRAIESADEGIRAGAMCELGRLCQYKKEYEQAEAWYTRAEEWLWLGRMYRDEEEIRDYDKATAYLLKEAAGSEKAFFTTAANELRDLYLDENFGPLEYDKLAALDKLAYSKEMTGQLYNLAMLYLDPQYGMQDMQQGMYWMYKAASLGEVLTDASTYRMTVSERKNIEKARAWFDEWGRENLGTADQSN